MKSLDIKPLSLQLKKFLSIQQKNTKVILVRNAESQGNLAGTITGWMDVHLTNFGRK